MNINEKAVKNGRFGDYNGYEIYKSGENLFKTNMNLEEFLEEEYRQINHGEVLELKNHDTRLINFVLDKVKEEMKNKTFMCDQLMGDLVVDMEDISTIIDNLKIK